MIEKIAGQFNDPFLQKYARESLSLLGNKIPLPLLSRLIEHCKDPSNNDEIALLLDSLASCSNSLRDHIVDILSTEEFLSVKTLLTLGSIFLRYPSQTRILETFVQHLSSQALFYKELILETLEWIGERAAIPSVIEGVGQCLHLAFQRKYFYLFKQATSVIEIFKSKAAHPLIFSALEQILDHPEEKARIPTAINTIQAIGVAPDSIKQKLTKYLDNKELRGLAVEALAVIGKATPALLSVIESFISSGSRPVFILGIKALAKLTVKEPTPQMLSQFATKLCHHDKDSRSFVARILRNIALKVHNSQLSSILQILLASLDKYNYDNSAWEALELIGDKAATAEVITCLQKHLNGENPVLRKRSIDILVAASQSMHSNPLVLAELAKCVRHKDKFIRKVAAEAICKIGEKSKIPIVLEHLEKNLESKELDIFESTTDVLLKIVKLNNSESLTKRLIACLKHHNTTIFTKAATILAMLGEGITMEILDELLVLINDKYHKQIADAFVTIGEKAAIPKVFAQLGVFMQEKKAAVSVHAT